MKRKNSLSSFRSMLYKVARVLGDVHAVSNGTMHKRITRRITGRITGKGMKSMFK